MEHPLYKDRWIDRTSEHYRFGLSKDVNTKTKVENDQGGYILGGSPTSGALGMGYSVAFLDDVLDSEQANSPDAVNKVNNWYTQTFLNRSNDVQNDVQIIFMQRLHQNDIINYVNTKYGDQGWFNLVLPAKYDPKRIFFSPIGFNDPRTMKNELLDPVRLPDSFLQAQAKNQLIYNTRYQQDPVGDGEGNLIQKEWLKEVDVIPNTYDQMMTVWDLSFGDEPKSSYSVGLVLGTKGDDYYVIDMIRERMAVPEQVDAIRKLRDKYPQSQIGIEKRANGNAAISLLQREITNIYAFQPRLYGGSKEQRLSAILPYLRDGHFHIFSPFTVDIRVESTYDAKEIIDELKAFPLGTNNDIVDCLAYGIQWLAQNGRESTAIITGGKQIIIPELDKVSDTYLRDRSTSDERLDSFEYDMFDGAWSRDDIIGGMNF
jgi:predicted phage terminase large subunit-like protein